MNTAIFYPETQSLALGVPPVIHTCGCIYKRATCPEGKVRKAGCCKDYCVDPPKFTLHNLREVKGSYFDLGDINVHEGAGTIFAPTGDDYVKAGRVNAKAGGSVVFMGI
eukprot:CAMPEP_0168613534 /NCGR_PEP_ID=MMETSP0449_2-20121227/3501_1 /TAXON_ID=1082188 /ORGANISM="Strombidium rassoulzadegani, Strain ras09" /LENGTH=108 /DNA_ID=CAMNT_0008654171 /DNA_START=22 /DNA_END=348 /DNA_ORIENTATION=-